MKDIIANLVDSLKVSTNISVLFLFLMCIVLILNVIRKELIKKEYYHGNLDEHCKYLTEAENGHTCVFTAYKKRFEENKNNCKGCPGKTFSMTESEAENRIVKESISKRRIIFLAHLGKDLLPYVSFLYTLLISMLINKK